MNNPSKSYTPGTRSSKLDEVTALGWNALVPHILGTSSSSGYTAVWDLRSKKEVVALAYGGGAATAGGPMGGTLAAGGRRGMSDVAWHPDNVSAALEADGTSLTESLFTGNASRHIIRGRFITCHHGLGSA